MPEVDFVMTYPCRFLLHEDGNPSVIIIAGEPCICLFTDGDLVERFYKEKHGDDFATRTISTRTAPNRLALIETLDDWQQQLHPQGCSHVAIDPGQGRAAYVTFAELLNDLKNRTD